MRTALTIMCCCLPLLIGAGPEQPPDDRKDRKADDTIIRGIAYLHAMQDKDGSWSPQTGPAITAMIVGAILDHDRSMAAQPAMRKAIRYILSKCKPDGGIHDGFLQNYNTAICLSALSSLRQRSDAAEAVQEAQTYLCRIQWAGQRDAAGRLVDRSHPFYGGAGYGPHGRPDMSNTQAMLQGLFDSGLPADDPAYQRALQFIVRCQGTAANDMFTANIVQDGGFIYATSVSKDLVGVPQSMANPELIDVAKAGRPISGLRTYGSMTYAGFKSYLYAALDRNDPRVRDAYEWIQRHYTLTQNPGLPEGRQMEGYYYYLMVVARALRAWDSESITSADGKEHNWADDLIDTLTNIQRPNGSWWNQADRWMEGDPNLVTAYALTALNNAVQSKVQHP